MLPAKFGSIWPSSFRGEDVFNISQSETRITLAAIFVGGMGRNEEIYRGPYIDAFCQVWFHLVELFQRSRLKYEKLTPIGKITVVKSLILPVLNHLFIALPNSSIEIIKDIEAMLYTFIWKSSVNRVKKDIMQKKYQEGGL